MLKQNHRGPGDNVARDKNVIHLPSPPPNLYEKGNIPHNLPFSNQKLFGRENKLEELHQKLQLEHRVAIVGMVGVGKTSLALQYAKEHLKKTYSGGICWVDVRDSDVGQKITEFATSELSLDLEELNKRSNIEAQVNLCWTHWKRIKREKDDILLVLDDVDVKNYKVIEDSIKHFPFKVLITADRSLSKSNLFSLKLKGMNQEAALEFLKSLVTSRPERVNEYSKDARKICKWLDNLPLGLELIGNYLNHDNNQDMALSEMLENLIMQRVLKEEGEKKLFCVLNNSWEALRPEGQQLAFLLSLFAPEPIPWSLVKEVIEENSRKPSKPVFDNLASNMEDLRNTHRGHLLDLFLLQYASEKTYKLHSVIRRFLREKLEEFRWQKDLERGFCQAMVTVVASEISSKPNQKELENFAPKIPHLEETARALTKHLSNKDLILPFIGLGRFYEGESRYLLAEKWYKEALESIKDRLKKKKRLFFSSVQTI